MGVGDMIDNDKYTIDPMHFALLYGQAWFKAGDMVDMITGDIIGGPYCAWPKQEPRYFILSGGKRQGKSVVQKLANELRERFK